MAIRRNEQLANVNANIKRKLETLHSTKNLMEEQQKLLDMHKDLDWFFINSIHFFSYFILGFMTSKVKYPEDSQNLLADFGYAISPSKTCKRCCLLPKVKKLIHPRKSDKIARRRVAISSILDECSISVLAVPLVVLVPTIHSLKISQESDLPP